MASFGRERNKKGRQTTTNSDRTAFPHQPLVALAVRFRWVALIAAPPLHGVRIAIKVKPEGESRKEERRKTRRRERENKRGGSAKETKDNSSQLSVRRPTVHIAISLSRPVFARLDCLVRLPPFAAVDERNGTSHLDEPIAFDIHWFQDGMPIVLPDSRRHLLANGSLYFDKFGRRIYNCLAQQRQTSSSSSSAGAFISRNVSVRVAVLAREFTTWPNDATVEMGDPVRFACEIESVPEAEITWEKDGVPVVTVTTQTDNQEDGHNGTDSSSIHPQFVKLESGKILHIYNVQSENAGNYRCVARNELAEKERKSQAGRLVVSSENARPNRLAQFISPPPPSDLWVVQGGNVTIECLATGTNTAVKWALNSTTSLPATGPGYLALTDIHPNMAGHYSCVAITAGSSVASASITQSTVVHVATVPQFVRLPKSQVFPTAKTVRFECEVTGIPSPEIRWFKDGRIVPIGGRIKNRIRNGGAFSELVLSNTVTGDSGIYQCQASNRAGVVSVSARLLVNVSEGTRPEPPSNLKAVALTTTVVMLTWDPPRNVPVDDVKAYTVHYMPLAAAGQHTSSNEELQEVATTSSHRIENLKRNANYSFYVRAYVRKSASDPSDKLIFNPAILIQSKDQAESSLPSSSLPRTTPRTLASPTTPNVTLLPLTPNTLRVTWRRFSSSSASSSSSVSFYKIQYRRHRAKEFDIEVVKGDIHEYTITGLHPGRKYDVRVLPGSMNGAGSGQWYTVEMPRVMADAGSSPTSPQSLPSAVMELMTANSTSVFVTWHNVGGRQTRPNIHLTYRIQGSRETSPVVILPTASGSRWITGLKPGSIYEFQLINNDADDGPSTVTSTIRTLWDAGFEHEEEDTDSEPMAIRMEAKVVSSNAIQLSWYVLPPESAATILYYTVRYVAIPTESTQDAVLTQFIRTTANQFQLTNLTAYTLYRISIRSHDRQGRSSTYSSPATDARTMADLPGPPLDVSFSVESSAGTTTGQLFWKAPYPVKGNILGYAILISVDPEAPIDTWTRKEEPGVWLRSQLRSLVPGTVYHVRMQARTSVGWGPLTPPLACPFLPAEGTGSISSVTDEKSNSNNDTAVRFSEQYLGAFIGLAVSVGLAIACSVSMLLRARCIKRMSPTTERPPSQLAGSSHVQQIPSADAVSVNGLANGRLQQQRHNKKDPVRRNGSLRNSRERSADASVLEMETFVPMLATIPLEDMPSHLDTKGGYPSGSRSSVAGRIITPTTCRKEEDDEEDEDRSELPLLSLSCSVVGHPGGLDGTILSQATETTCLSLDYSSKRRRSKRQGSLHDDDEGDSSLHSLDSGTTSSSQQRHHRSSSEAISCTSDDSSRSLREDQQDTGMCHADHHQMMNDSGLVVVTSGALSSSSNNNRSQTTPTTPKGTADQEQQLVIST
ncbi:hypothetical protein GHT06_019598 [Daphnia sinensis]|uniref:Uncharacterized protein n=1 Tax=Daphnia sinensis TaxID=1820382 RepID=A0AAD5PNS2_9CRUS|nr:hypothetical protein GHT06_019598 [Daphnia sinensis]